MKRGDRNSAGREGPEWPSGATNRPKASAAALKKRLSAVGCRRLPFHGFRVLRRGMRAAVKGSGKITPRRSLGAGVLQAVAGAALLGEVLLKDATWSEPPRHY